MNNDAEAPNLDGRELTDKQLDARKVWQGTWPASVEQWGSLAAIVLDRLGFRRVVRLADQRLWRQALAEGVSNPGPSIEFPTLLWKAYIAEPYSAIQFRLADGRIIPVRSWSELYYCWHTRHLAFRSEGGVLECYAEEIESVEYTAPPNSRCTMLEQLRRLSCSELFVPFGIRTWVRVYNIHSRAGFKVDTTGRFVVLCDQNRIHFVDVKEIESIHLANQAPARILEQLMTMIDAKPFVPFQVCILGGGYYPINDPRNVLVTEDYICVGLGAVNPGVWKSVVCIYFDGVDKLELLPAVAGTAQPLGAVHPK